MPTPEKPGQPLRPGDLLLFGHMAQPAVFLTIMLLLPQREAALTNSLVEKIFLLAAAGLAVLALNLWKTVVRDKALEKQELLPKAILVMALAEIPALLGLGLHLIGDKEMGKYLLLALSAGLYAVMFKTRRQGQE